MACKDHDGDMASGGMMSKGSGEMTKKASFLAHRFGKKKTKGKDLEDKKGGKKKSLPPWLQKKGR